MQLRLPEALESLRLAGPVRVRYRLAVGVSSPQTEEAHRSIGRSLPPPIPWDCTGVLDYGVRRALLSARSCGDECVRWVDDSRLVLGPQGMAVDEAVEAEFWPNPLWWLDLLRMPAEVGVGEGEHLRVLAGRARLPTGPRWRWRRRERAGELDVILGTDFGVRSVKARHKVVAAHLDILGYADEPSWPTDTLFLPTGASS
ncbi:MAG: hypothetical protein LT070_13495 [Solirubrobacteraceae bacterium]|nr:hypothetical protein [Solirubrobacteraceae bacterium]